MVDEADRKPHFVIEGFTETENYTPPTGGPKRKPVPPRDRESHAASLLSQIEALSAQAETTSQAPASSEPPEGLDLQVEFVGFPEVELAFESLARERSGIELRNVRSEGDHTLATVFVPAGKLGHFEKLVKDYLNKKVDKNNQPRDNQRLIDAIQEIRRASVQALWTDEEAALPQSKTEAIWWEVWLSVRNDSDAVASFRQKVQGQVQVLEVSVGALRFPERAVLLVRASMEQLQSSMLVLNSVAELRRAKETADLFDGMPPDEQAEWIDELLARTEFAGRDTGAPHVCLLDTGVNRGHRLIAPGLAETDLHSVEPGWGLQDDHGHGTQMAGLALCGDLTGLLAGAGPVVIEHRLESVKLLPTDGANAEGADFHGYLTTEAVARPEVAAPARSRVFGMAVTARDRRDRGRPSAWSAAIDRIASDADAEEGTKSQRLLVLSAGNIEDPHAWANYADSSAIDSIQDPGQAWNALTVGACTELTTITEEGGASPVAPAGGLSPFSTTSTTWERHWPLKPDVLLEGGNVAKDGLGSVWTQSLSLLTTSHKPAESLLTCARATSAAMAQAARMAAQIMAPYPNLWPETVRGLIVHSAHWTPRMRSQFLPPGDSPTKNDFIRLVRTCGFGRPDLDRARWSVANSLTLIAQEEMTPFKREAGKDVTARELHLHKLPWPREILEGLGETDVELRVTLSYFIEPNPSARGVKSRYAYASHGFRFDVIRPLESLENFRKRINFAARAEDEEAPDSPEDEGWIIGTQGRHKGSIHSDIWRGSAAELASRGTMAVYPSRGWWKTRPTLERFNRSARYALIVSITAPQVEVDLYAEVAAKISTGISIEH